MTGGDLCEGCDFCCSSLGVCPVNENDISKIGRFLHKKYDAVKEEFVIFDGVGLILKSQSNGACVFLNNLTKKCLIYACRPQACQTFPEKAKITFSLLKKCRLARYISNLDTGE
ncbi:putative zinc- or iron-chelating protein [Thiocapsa rosea]|uniref:Putative zinc-or iron-chelating protein n=1 Tax=Thiocapsa rosea TaxID=69360 RepID=A0A495UNJ1_9GAMM|nr:putative zinc- or iron-chelating protein [Thiocapsa rosea]